MFPEAVDEDSAPLTQEIVGAIAEFAKHDEARGALSSSDVIPKLLSLLKVPSPKQQKGDPKLGVLRAIKAMSGSESAVDKIVTEGGVPMLVGFFRDNRESMARESIRVVAALGKNDSARASLTKSNAPQELALLLKSTKRLVLEEVATAIAVIGPYDKEFFSAHISDVAQPLADLAKTYPNAYKAIAGLIENDAFRDKYIEGNLIEQLKLEMQKDELKLVQEITNLVRKLAQHDNSRMKLAENNIASEIIYLLKSKTSVIAQEASNTIEQLTRHRDMINQDFTQHLVPLAKDERNPKTTLAIVRVIVTAQITEYYQTAQELVPGLFELMRSDEALSREDGELAADARDLSLDVIALSCHSENTPTKLIESLGNLLKFACIRSPYYWGSYYWDSDRMTEFTCRAFGVVKMLSDQPKPRRELIAEGIFETVAQLLDSPVTSLVDNAARELVDELKSDDEIYAEIRKHMPRSYNAPDVVDAISSISEPESVPPEPEQSAIGGTIIEPTPHVESPEGSTHLAIT
ncbi:ARM repeat-containing protein [Ceratobasidium sp. AG-I]|nr:ARM repeat-containing protein [Ceratobasidium sp. AG-I]